MKFIVYKFFTTLGGKNNNNNNNNQSFFFITIIINLLTIVSTLNRPSYKKIKYHYTMKFVFYKSNLK